ncbi:MAG: peptidoglycan-binding protein [Firmicutes bacterium HGW-Firmicutes-16]|nr:MAG: peptidoglycan-binding protein [Firmicutes bacterium HGW-Firmicutes-16]
MKFILFDPAAADVLVFPVTPSGFEVSHGIRIETVNIHTLGDTALAGYGTLPSFKVDCMLPAKDYPFNQPEAATDPYSYTRKLEAWCDARTVLRFVITETPINSPVKIEDITYGEKDGTGDVYATVTLRKYRELSAVQTQSSATGNTMRLAEATAAVTSETYTVKSGDTLSAIARKFYGDASLYPKLAKYNGIKNANIISIGQVIKIPDKGLL